MKHRAHSDAADLRFTLTWVPKCLENVFGHSSHLRWREIWCNCIPILIVNKSTNREVKRSETVDELLMMNTMSESYQKVFDLNTTKRVSIVEYIRMQISSDVLLFPCVNRIASLSYD